MQWRALNYQWVLAFFGLNLEYKNIVLEEVHTLCYHGNGGFTHNEVYNMPIRYRHYHLKKIADFIENQNNTTTNNTSIIENKENNKKIYKPDFITNIKAPK